ncbi:MAG: ribose 5-phosphate isomerase B [Nitrospirae bacterium]|nr:MAG: ribose 5-phosphate isomerase B [Nitrospirota bacterium]
MSEEKERAMLAIGADHGGFHLKEVVIRSLERHGVPFVDLGTHDESSVDYPDYAEKVASGVASGDYDRGILICGTGIGMSIAANKFFGVRAALCHNTYTARMSRAHNDANILVLGGRVIGPGVAEEIVDVWLETPFDGGRHARRVEKIHFHENSRPPQAPGGPQGGR